MMVGLFAVMMAALAQAPAAPPGDGPDVTVPHVPLPPVPPRTVSPLPQASVWKPGDGPRSPRPAGRPGAWVTSSDYPSEALRLSIGGRSDFLVDVGPDGRATGCTTLSSSGSRSLDERACQLMMQRARFFPALDADGQPTVGTYVNRVRWQPPKPRANRFVDETVIVEFTLGVDGVPYGCRDEVTGNRAGSTASEKRSPCATIPRFEPFRDAQGRPVERRVRTQTITTVE